MSIFSNHRTSRGYLRRFAIDLPERVSHKTAAIRRLHSLVIAPITTFTFLVVVAVQYSSRSVGWCALLRGVTAERGANYFGTFRSFVGDEATSVGQKTVGPTSSGNETVFQRFGVWNVLEWLDFCNKSKSKKCMIALLHAIVAGASISPKSLKQDSFLTQVEAPRTRLYYLAPKWRGMGIGYTFPRPTIGFGIASCALPTGSGAGPNRKRF